MRRTTIKDIAKAAGVSPGAVSFALNDRPGVSEETRARVKRVAADLGWTRSAAAAALSGQRAGAVGLVMQRGAGDDEDETFFMRFMAGVHEVLHERHDSMVFQIVPDEAAEVEAYRTWWGEGRVDGVLLLRPSRTDRRREVLTELGMPGVVVGAPVSQGISSVCADEPGTTQQLVDHFALLGHSSIGYVTGPVERHYIAWRTEAFLARTAQLGLASQVVHVESENEIEGMRASQRLVRGAQAPTALIFDNELLAMGGLAACHDAGLVVGRDVGMASFEDSAVCRMARPGISALRRRTEEIGALAARSLYDLMAGGDPDFRIGPLPDLAVRASSGLARKDSERIRDRDLAALPLAPGEFAREAGDHAEAPTRVG